MKASTWLTVFAALSAFGVPADGHTQQPFALDDNLIRLKAEVNNRPVTAVLDSGTGQILLDRAAAAHLNISPEPGSIAALGGGTNTQTLRPLSLSEVSFGPVHLGTTRGFSMSLTPLSTSAGFDIDAILGGPVFANRIVEVDYKRDVIRFPAVESPITCGNPLPVSITNGVPVVTATLRMDGNAQPRVLHLIVDLGTRHFAAMIGGPFPKTAIVQEAIRRGRLTQIGTGTGGKIEGVVARINQLQLGEQTFFGLQVALTREVKAFESGTVDGTLGVPLWRGGSITFDYPHQRVCIQPGS